MLYCHLQDFWKNGLPNNLVDFRSLRRLALYHIPCPFVHGRRWFCREFGQSCLENDPSIDFLPIILAKIPFVSISRLRGIETLVIPASCSSPYKHPPTVWSEVVDVVRQVISQPRGVCTIPNSIASRVPVSWVSMAKAE